MYITHYYQIYVAIMLRTIMMGLYMHIREKMYVLKI